MRDIKRMNKLSQEEFHDTPGNRRKENGRRARRKDSRTRAIRTGLKQNVGLDQKSSKAQYLAGRPTDIPYTHNLDTNPTMFYEFSIQYDDPVITMFRETSPVSDMLYFNVTHAYPNWIPPHYPRLLTENKPPEPGEKATMDSSSSTNSFLTFSKFKHSLSARNDTERTDELSSYMALQYHRYIHLFHSYFDTYEPRDTTNLPQHSVTALAVKLLAPFVPQGNWTNGGTPPAPNEFFYRAFPKVSPDFDNDYHNRNPGVFWGWFYLSRWLPDLIQRVLFPLDQMVYNSNVNGIGTDAKAGVEKNASYNSTSIQEEVLKNTPNARKLTGKQTPTKLECALCERFDGVKIWNKNGEWFCIYKEKFEELEGKNRSASEREDCQGNGESKDTAYFHSFNEFIRWRTSYSNKLLDLEKKAYCAGDMAEMENLEKEIRDVKSAASSSDHIKSNYISLKPRGWKEKKSKARESQQLSLDEKDTFMGSNDSVGVFDTGMGNPLPLPYTINGKHSEITSTNATRQDTKASKTATVVDAMEQLHHETPAAENSGSLVNDPGPSVRRKVHAVIGNPLPLEYLDGENKVLKNKVSADTDPGTVDPFVVEKPLNAVDVSVSGGASDQTQAENDVVEKPTVKRPRNLKLSDIGDPLPLSYSPQVVGLESRLTHGVAKAPHQRMPLKIYDLGTPLPLEYMQDGEKTVGQETIRTDTYLKWKTTASDLPFDEWVEAQKKPDQATDEQNPKNVTCHNAVPNPPQELAGPKCSTGANCQATSGGSLVPAGEEPEDTTAVQSPGPQKPLGMSMYEHIALLVSRRDRLQLENRSRNAEFKKELIRYAEEAKEQVDFLSELLGENVTATPTGKQALTVSTTISTCVLLSAVMLLCTLSYLLAD